METIVKYFYKYNQINMPNTIKYSEQYLSKNNKKLLKLIYTNLILNNNNKKTYLCRYNLHTKNNYYYLIYY